MSNSVWSKKTLAVIAIAAFVGTLSPVAANAWDSNQGPDEIVTVTVDLGENPEDGGGGGNVCTGFGSLSIPLTNMSVTKERKVLKTAWAGDTRDDDNDANTPSHSDRGVLDISGNVVRDTRDFSVNPLDPYIENTRTNYVSSDFVVAFDADNCEVSSRQGYVWTERQPVERYSTGVYQPGTYWQPVEMTWEDGLLDASTLRATADLLVDYTIFGANRANVPIYNQMSWENRPQNPGDISSWGTAFPNMDMPVIWGSGGEANVKASITIYGDVPLGKYRVKHGFTLDTDDQYNSGPWLCFIGGCP